MNSIYCTHDTEANVFFGVKVLPDDVVAKRAFRLACKQELKEFKNAFRLVKIGAFDEKTGTIMSVAPEEIIHGSIVQLEEVK